jgi:hypothetical protein
MISSKVMPTYALCAAIITKQQLNLVLMKYKKLYSNIWHGRKFVRAAIALLKAGTVSFNSYKANPQLQLSEVLVFHGDLRATQTFKRKQILLSLHRAF